MEELRGREERASLLAAFEADLPTFLPDVRIADRGLDLSRGPIRGIATRRADLVAFDGAGRPVIVILVDGRGDDVILTAANAVAFVRQNSDALARSDREEPAGGPLATQTIGPSGGPGRVALVAESYAARTLEGLALLPESELLVFEVRRIESSSGSQVRFARLSPAPQSSAAPADRTDRQSFLSRIPETRRGVAELLLRRLSRLDSGIQITFEAGAASFRCEGRELCVLLAAEGELLGAIPALKRSLPIHGPDDADAFLDEILREHLLVLGEGWGTRSRSVAGETPGREAREPLLTAEEMAAFRE
jgi:hypothetical protein